MVHHVEVQDDLGLVRVQEITIGQEVEVRIHFILRDAGQLQFEHLLVDHLEALLMTVGQLVAQDQDLEGAAK